MTTSLQVVFLLSLALCMSFSYASTTFDSVDDYSFGLRNVSSAHSLSRRQTSSDDYTCGPDRPCKNGACCGKSNVCGYGPVYCGDGCQSHCDAHAECGTYAEYEGKTCPLNVCCSQFGFCGQTTDFCGTGCQSNCGQSEFPSREGYDVRKNIIGYWEAWKSEGVPCSMPPDSIPVEGLDQLNVAFAYIDLYGFRLMGMDGIDADKIFTQVANLKTRNPHLKVWASVGGWTFNDPGPYRPLFSKIAGNEKLSEIFADNCVKFMKQYGLDGIDIDWEYPGAEDRGGNNQTDYDGFPRMLGIMQQAFKGHGGKKYGLTITIPTSYWYLRWFNLRAIQPLVDSFNLMSYDLHGLWDRDTDQLGPYVWAHTNITEIERALVLLSGAGVDHEKVNLGLAFYGRTFELQSRSCSSPGCRFIGPGAKDRCTDTAGILSYKEIQARVKRGDLNGAQYYEKEGVFLSTYDGGRSWISFDDTSSFQAKVDLANKRGLGGLFIWAVDQDDDDLNALRAVTGRDLITPVRGSKTFGAFDLSKCYITSCGEPCSPSDTTMTHLNQAKDGRGCDGKNHHQRSFCCPPATAPDPKFCYWDAGPQGPTNCHGSCKRGDIAMLEDDYGDSEKACKNHAGKIFQKKVWCCPATNGMFNIGRCTTVQGNRATCPRDKPQELTYFWNAVLPYDKDGEGAQHFCCPAEPVWKNCAWHGNDQYCNFNHCPLGQMEIFQHAGYTPPFETPVPRCGRGRTKVFCCDPPLTHGSPFLPVPLKNLFPDAESFPPDWSPEFAEAFDHNRDLIPPPSSYQDPNQQSFAWVIMVGDPSDVQSLDKRDGTHLELFDCPNPESDDLSVQKVRAICLTDDGNNDCEDIAKGGVTGTVVRLPARCGPDTWVRAVSWEKSDNRTLPPHLEKRARSHHQVYDFYYDYDFKNLRRDGGEVYVRVDASNHPGYWNEVVRRHAGAPFDKRDASSWRDIDKRFWDETDSFNWVKAFYKVMDTPKKAGLRKKYTYKKCLFSARATCGANKDATAYAIAAGELETTEDFGVTLIGKLRNFEISEAFSFFRHEDFEVKLQGKVYAEARLKFNSGMQSLPDVFPEFGSNFNIKGILTINPYVRVKAQVEAEVTASVEASFEVSISNENFRFFFPQSLGVDSDSTWEPVGRLPEVRALGKIQNRLGGDIIVTSEATVGFDIALAFDGRKVVDTSIKLDTKGVVDLRVSTSTTDQTCRDIGVEVLGQVKVSSNVTSALKGWSPGERTWYETEPGKLFEACLVFASGLKRGIGSHSSTDEALDGLPLLPRGIETERPTGTCAWNVERIYCADDHDDEFEPDCNILKYLPDVGEGDLDDAGSKRDLGSVNAFSDEVANGSADAELHTLEKRADRDNKVYCDPTKGFGPFNVAGYDGVSASNRGNIKYLPYPRSGKVKLKYGDRAAYDIADEKDCNNYNLVKRAAQEIESSDFNAEHVLEWQMIPSFMNTVAKLYSDIPGKKNNDVKLFREPRTNMGTALIPWCQYMKLWWGETTASANNQIVTAYPSTNNHEEELILLRGSLNFNVKSTWWQGTQIYCENSMDELLGNADTKENYEKYLACMKASILTYKYYYEDEVVEILARQAQRVEERLKYIETNFIPDIVRKKKDRRNKDQDFFALDYQNQDLADLWRTFVRKQHEAVQERVKDFVLNYAQKLYDLKKNTKDAKILLEVTTLLKEAKALTTWSIPWDDPDEMDIDD